METVWNKINLLYLFTLLIQATWNVKILKIGKLVQLRDEERPSVFIFLLVQIILVIIILIVAVVLIITTILIVPVIPIIWIVLVILFYLIILIILVFISVLNIPTLINMINTSDLTGHWCEIFVSFFLNNIFSYTVSNSLRYSFRKLG